MKQSTISTIFVFIMTVALAILYAPPSKAHDTLPIKYIGSSTVGKYIEEATKVYTKSAFTLHTKVESGGGERATAMGKADLGGVAREVGQEFIDKGVKTFLIGRDAIGAWVNRKNPVSELTSAQLADIFSGKIKNWKEVGGSDLPITIYVVDVNSATRKVFSKGILGEKRYGGKVKLTRPDHAIIEQIAGDIGGIGHLSFALGDNHPQSAMAKKIDIDGQKASVNNPDYPVTRPLYLITKGEPKGAVKEFIDWTLSPEGQKIVKKYFVGI